MRLPMEHRAGQGAGDAVNDLDAGDHQPAQLIQTGRLNLGDDVVGAGDVLGHLHTIQIAERLGDMGDLADLGLDEHVGAQHRADLLASYRAIALTWQLLPGRSLMPRNSQAVDDIDPEH